MYKDYLKKYAELIVKVGINLQEGQQIKISCDYQAIDLLKEVIEVCYKDCKSGKVDYTIGSSAATKAALEFGSIEALTTINENEIQKQKDVIKNGTAILNLYCPNPELLKDLDPKKFSTISNHNGEVFSKYREEQDNKHLSWCIAAYVSDEWATIVFPNMKLEDAKEKLWDMVFKTCRIYDANPLKAWDNHIDELQKKARVLNSKRIKTVHYKSAKTDFTVNMTDKYKFASAGDINNYGKIYVPNIPTEEVFSSPDYRTANGVLAAELPLNVRGTLIKDFWFRFENGVVVDFDAKEGKEALGLLLDSDEGARRLGEIALVPIASPISNLNTLFYNTLFDENARCHFALGKSFAECYEGAFDLDKDERLAVGLNQSIIHVDFMVGSPDLNITATLEEGGEFVIFKDGNFAF